MSIDPIERMSLTLSVGAVAASLALATPAFTTGIVIGAALETANFRGLRQSAQAVFSGRMAARRFGSAGFGLRFAFLALGIGLAIYAGAHPVGLLIGLSLIIPATFVEAWRRRPPVLEDAPALASDDEAWDRWNPWLAHEREAEEDDEA